MNKLKALWRRLRRAGGVAATPPRPATSTPDEFDLDLVSGRAFETAAPDGSVRSLLPAWHGPRLALHLAPGSDLTTSPIHLRGDVVLRVDAAATGRPCTLRVTRLDGVATTAIATITLADAGPRTLLVSLDGRNATGFRVQVTADGDVAALLRLQIAAPHRLARLDALSGYQQRVAAEIAHFSGAAYTHAMYGPTPDPTGKGTVHSASNEHGAAVGADLEQRHEGDALARLVKLPPAPGEATFVYAMRALGTLLPTTPPDFLNRADRLTGPRPLRMLSLCSGAARIEEQILANAKQAIHLTLLDASRDLIQRAADRLTTAAPHHRVDCLVGDVNRGLPGDDQFDVIVCVSALHHIADLERVFADIGGRLAEGGEFWSIGEQIGRNGNRLWPEAQVAANRAFARLPDRLRRNAHTGRADARLNDDDFSIGCFEGIRSEELETMLEAHLLPVDVYKRNAFLWRLVDATYADNYRLDAAEDLQHLRELVAAEFAHWATGGRATELHGVYRKKELRRS
jgi:SAM-dependent methyltransferase